MDEDEFLDVKRFSIEEIQELIEKGEMVDSKSLAALLLARAYLK
jgi:anti-sigma28 factor (negative regulator of flagellin synthesis)